MAGLVFFVGLVLGTLLNTIIIRLPRERNLFRWPLCCTRTGKPLLLWQLLPVLGWLLQRGRVQDGRQLHWIFPLVELLTASVLTILYVRYGFSPTFFYLAFVCSGLIITGAIDWLHRLIYTFVIIGSVVVVLIGVGGRAIPTVSLSNAIVGLLIAGVGFLLLFLLARLLFPSARSPFGLGDVYLGMFIGASIGLTRLGPALWYGILMAGVVSAGIVFAKHVLRRSNLPTYISYGSYLCLGTIVYIVTARF